MAYASLRLIRDRIRIHSLHRSRNNVVFDMGEMICGDRDGPIIQFLRPPPPPTPHPPTPNIQKFPRIFILTL